MSADNDTVRRLATLSPLEYDRARKAEAEALGVRPGTLDKLVSAARKEEADSGLALDVVEPWADPVHPAELLTDIAASVRRFIVCSAETADAVALWSAMTWVIDVVQVAPLAVIAAPEKRCGKSQLLALLGKLVSRPLTASNISPAALFRSIDAWRPTLLVDEADAFMRENEELRGLLNCGHTRDSAYVVRVVGENFTPTKFNVWGAKTLAGIGHLADTLMDRAITLELRRKLPHEAVERLRHAEPDLFETLAAKLARFAGDYRDAVRLARPCPPESLNDRAQDNWEPLLAIAQVAGGDWPNLARKAALKLSGGDSLTQSVGTELLTDVQEIFDLQRIDRLSSTDLIAALCGDEEKPWATYNRGKPISPRQVSKRLGEYGIQSKDMRFGHEGTRKGYMREWFDEAFSRYLAPPEKSPFIRNKTPEAAPDVASGVADYPQRCGNISTSATPEATADAGCCGVADKPPYQAEMGKTLVSNRSERENRRTRRKLAGGLIMNAKQIVSKMRRAGFVFNVWGDKLMISPADKLTQEQREFIRAHKQEIIRELAAAGRPIAVQFKTADGGGTLIDPDGEASAMKVLREKYGDRLIAVSVARIH